MSALSGLTLLWDNSCGRDLQTFTPSFANVVVYNPELPIFSGNVFALIEGCHPWDSAQDLASHGLSEEPRNDGLDGRETNELRIRGTNPAF